MVLVTARLLGPNWSPRKKYAQPVLNTRYWKAFALAAVLFPTTLSAPGLARVRLESAGPPHVVTFDDVLPDPSGGQRPAGRLTVIIRSPSGSRNRISARLLSTATPSATLLRVRPRRADRSGLTAVVATFALPDHAQPHDLQGALVLSIGNARLAISVVGATPKLVVQPSHLSMTVTRWLGPLSGVCRCWLSGTNTQVDLAGNRPGVRPPPGRVALRSASGERATALLRTTGHRSDRLASGRLEIVDVERPDRYSGAVPTSADDDATAVAVGLSVRDGPQWALAAVLLGALLGGGLVQWHEARRRRKILQGELRRAFRPYREQLRETNIEGIYVLDDDLDPDSTTPVAALFPRRRRCREDLRGVARLYCDAYGVDPERYSQLTAEVMAAVAAVERRDRLVARARQLREEFESARLAPTGTVESETRALLQLLAVEPPDDEAATLLERRLVAQRRVLQGLTAALVAWMRVPLETREKQDIASLRPETIYDSAPDEPSRRTADIDLLLQRLAQAREALRDFAAPLPASARRLINMAMPAPGFSISRRGSGDLRRSPRGADPLLRSVRRWDFIVGGIVAVATALAYLLPVYVGHAWGSWSDYATAFTAGAVGQVGGAAVWSRFPAMRSYRAPLHAPDTGGPAPPQSGPAEASASRS